MHVAGGGDDRLGAECVGESAGERVGPAEMAGEDGLHVAAGLVEVDDGGIGALVGEVRREAAHADAQRADEGEGVERGKRLGEERLDRGDRPDARIGVGACGDDDGGGLDFEETQGKDDGGIGAGDEGEFHGRFSWMGTDGFSAASTAMGLWASTCSRSAGRDR